MASLIGLGVALLAANSASVDLVSNDIPRITRTIVVDGKLDAAEWSGALRIDVNIETSPGENTASPVHTTALLLEDSSNLYVAFDARDPHPDKIRAFLRDRDSAWDDDFVGIVIDSFGDERRAFEFFANALGVQMDLTNDDVNQNEDASWDAIWDSAGKITADGFVVEMRIPLRQLRFARIAGKQTWGIDLLRFYPRDRRYRLANNAQDRDLNCYLCQLQKYAGFDNAEPGRDLEFVPTLTASKSETTSDPGNLPLQSGDTSTEAGLSVRWGITPDLTANLAINPDFSQVEADAAQLDVNNQFALFFPEKRTFFLEGADYFRTPLNVVFTRTVADPSVGAKLTGKRGDNTFGVFVAQDEITNLIFPGAFGSAAESLQQENTAFVGRYSRSFGDTSRVGAILTNRSGDGYHNTVGGVDLRWKINDQHIVQAQYLRSDTEYPLLVAAQFDQPQNSFSGVANFASYSFDSRNWFAYARHIRREETFRADSGFVPQVNTSKQIVGLGRTWHGDASSWYSNLRVSGDWDITHDDDGRLLEKELEFRISVDGPLQSQFRAGGISRDVLFDNVLFEEWRLRFFASMKPRGGVSVGFFSSIGDQIDFANTRIGRQRLLSPFLSWNIGRHLLLRYDGSFVDFDRLDGPAIFTASVQDVRLTWQFSLRSFLRVTAQFQDIKRNPLSYVSPVQSRSRNLGRQLLYSYKLNPQTVFFLGYSDQLLDNDSLSELTTSDRSLFMKIGYAWNL
jgi:hypothetical protein